MKLDAGPIEHREVSNAKEDVILTIHMDVVIVTTNFLVRHKWLYQEHRQTTSNYICKGFISISLKHLVVHREII